MYITTKDQLKEITDKLQHATAVGIDTEFLRDKTFYPKLCLIQICFDNVCAAIDPLAIEDISEFVPVLTNPSITKIFHAGDQDIAILYKTFKVMPVNVFDTQRAAQLLGLPFQIGLAALVRRMCNITLDKGDTLTDWAARPLSDRQIAYALNDVRYLPQIFKDMSVELSKLGRSSWVDYEIKELLNPAKYDTDVTEAYLRVKHTAQLDQRQLAIVRELADWRENLAREKDVPRKWLLTDEMIVAIARRKPKSIDELLTLHPITGNIKRYAREIVAFVKVACLLTDAELPTPLRSDSREGDFGAPIDLMLAMTHHKARESRIASQLLCSRSELNHLAQGKREDLRVLESWRFELLGKYLLELLEGKLVLSLKNDNLEVTKSPQ